MEQIFNKDQAIAGQKKFCNEKVHPHFAPLDGKCYRCNKNIYEPIDRGTYKTGHSVEKATTHLITGCPHCNYSFVD